jgi:hypothetical protein
MNYLKPNVVAGDATKPLINIGALFDIPTGFYLKGKYGENILNGGLGVLTGVVGIGNNFKSTLLHYQSLSAMDKIFQSVYTSLNTYDTELNMHESRLYKLTVKFESFKDKNIIKDGDWVITDKTIYFGNEWFEKLKDFSKIKKDNIKTLTVEFPFLDRDGESLVTGLVPTFGEMDSLSEMLTSDVSKMQDDNEIGESGANTMHMKLGLAKTRMFMELPMQTVPVNHFLLITGQIGKVINMATGPFAAQPTKKLSYLKNGDEIKGVSSKFFYAMSNFWHCYNASPLLNQATRAPEYPKTPDNVTPGDTDLNIVNVRQLRSKSGMTGVTLEILVSQTEGVLATLSEFHYIKGRERFGLGGNNTSYYLEIYPEGKLSRNTVRNKIDTNPTLRRAMNITSELCQMHEFWHDFDRSLLCTPKELYDDLKAMGYDWDVLLNTRGWWTVNNDKHPIPFLSTMDFLEMRKGTYKPYWMKDK